MKSILQTRQWASFKEKQGWKVFNVENVFILEKTIPLGKNFLYAPEVSWQNPGKINKLLENIPKNINKNRTIFFRLEILNELNQNIVADLTKLGFIKAFEEIQPEWRQIVDISKPEEEILAQMKPKGRYNIRVAQKHKIEVTQTSSVDEFFKLYEETSKRDKFEGRNSKYFEDLVQSLGQDCSLFIAKYQGKALAGLIITFYEGLASYLYGASSSELRQFMAPYLAHWQVILEAKKRGCTSYDLLAIEPFKESDPQSDDRPLQESGNINNINSLDASQSAVSVHKYSGISRFKEQFGGRKVHLVGSWDLVYKPIWYRFFKKAEKIRRN